MPLTDYIEYPLGKLFYSFRGRDSDLFTRSALFSHLPPPPGGNITITSPDNGPSGSSLLPSCTQVGADNFPALSWTVSSSSGVSASEIKEYILVVQDADVPVPFAVIHGIFWGIPGATTSIGAADVQLNDAAKGRDAGIKAGWNIGAATIPGRHYSGARPIVQHGPHRYFYQVIGLKEKLDGGRAEGAKLPRFGATRKQIEEAIGKGEGNKVVAWGQWVGVFERKLGQRY